MNNLTMINVPQDSIKMEHLELRYPMQPQAQQFSYENTVTMVPQVVYYPNNEA